MVVQMAFDTTVLGPEQQRADKAGAADTSERPGASAR